MNKYLLFIFLFFYTTFSRSQGPPITVQTPVMLGLEGSGIRTFGKFISKENVTIYVQPIAMPYNISSKFQIGGIIPFKFINSKESDVVSGFSDITLFAKYQLYKKDGKAKTFRILANLKQTFPTGKISSMPAIGTGFSQTYIGLIVGRINSEVGIYGDFGYTVTNKEATDKFSSNFSFGVPLLPQKYPQKQINVFLEFNGNYLFDTNVHSLFVSPGLQFIPGRRFLFETSFQIPVLQQNILINKTNYMMLFGTRFLFN